MRRERVVEVERAGLEVRKNFFTIRVAKEWNILPDRIKMQKGVDAFKNAYDACKRNGSRNTNSCTISEAAEQPEHAEDQARTEQN